MKVHSFDELDPISLQEIRGGGSDPCCQINFACNENDPPTTEQPIEPPKENPE